MYMAMIVVDSDERSSMSSCDAYPSIVYLCSTQEVLNYLITSADLVVPPPIMPQDHNICKCERPPNDYRGLLFLNFALILDGLSSLCS